MAWLAAEEGVGGVGWKYFVQIVYFFSFFFFMDVTCKVVKKVDYAIMLPLCDDT
jgi:hypothetical protein